MEILYTHHARHRILVRSITEEMVEKALSNPDRRGTGYQNRSLAWKTFENGTIKVVYSKENKNYVIISVMWSNI